MARSKKILTVRTFIMLSIFIVLTPSLPLLISRRWDWWEAWVYALLSIFGFIISRLIAYRKNPDLIVERSEYLQHDTSCRASREQEKSKCLVQ